MTMYIAAPSCIDSGVIPLRSNDLASDDKPCVPVALSLDGETVVEFVFIRPNSPSVRRYRYVTIEVVVILMKVMIIGLSLGYIGLNES